MKVSVIATVLNEGVSISRLLDSLVSQTRQADEVIIVDGGSTDDTVAIMETYRAKLPLQIITFSGANISQGRNRAIKAASGVIIASTDAGVVLAADWLAELITPFEQDAQVEVVSGFFIPDPYTPLEVAMGATILPLISDIDPKTFLPSSRSIAFKKTAWQAVQGYPEWLDFCEDLIFDFKLLKEAGAFKFAAKAIAYFRPRSSLSAFFKQYYQYARGDGKADLWRKRHAIRYFTYLVALPTFLLLGWLLHPICWVLGGVIGAIGLFYTPYRRLFITWKGLSLSQKLATVVWVPIIRITGDVAKMIGYPVGWWWRRKRIPSDKALVWR